MPSARTQSKALQDAVLQSARANRTANQRPNPWLVQQAAAAVLRPTVAQWLAPRVPTGTSSSTTTTAKQQQKRTSDPSSQHSWESLDCSFGLHQRHQHEQRGRDDRQWAATHVCPPWFGNEFLPTTLTNYEEPDLILVTSNEIPVYGYRWIHFNNENDQSVVPGETTYPICVKADTLGVWDQLQQGHTRSEAQGVLQHDAEEQERLILHQVDGRNNAARNAAENWDSDSGEQTSSNDSANNSDTTRTTNDERRQHTHTHSHTHTHMGNEQRRTSCPNPQKVEESTLHAFQHGLS